MAVAKTAGWIIVRRWEHEVRAGPDEVASSVARIVASGRPVRPRSAWRVFQVEPVDTAGTRERRHEVDILRPSRTRVIERRRSTTKGW
jgi:hypothetical protein